MAAALAGLGAWSLVIYQIASAAIEAVVLCLTYPIRPGLRPSWPHLRELNRYGYYSSADRVLLVLDTVVLRGLVGWVGGVDQVGGYVFARSLLGLGAQLLLFPISRVAVPVFAGLQGQPLALARSLRGFSVASCAVGLPAFVGLALVAAELVPLMFGTSWLPTIPLLQLLAVAAAALPLGNVDVALMRGTGRVGLQLVLSARLQPAPPAPGPAAGRDRRGRHWLGLRAPRLAAAARCAISRWAEPSASTVPASAAVSSPSISRRWRWLFWPWRGGGRSARICRPSRALPP